MSSSYTVYDFNDEDLLDRNTLNQIQSNAEAVFEYLDRYIDWLGAIEIVNIVVPNNYLMDDLDGAIYVGVSQKANGENWSNAVLLEALSGIDQAPEWDVAFLISLGRDGTLKNLGYPIWVDPNPNPYGYADVPSGYDDLFSILLSQALVAFGFYGNTVEWDEKLVEVDGFYYFEGERVDEIFGGPLPLAPADFFGELPDRYGNDLNPNSLIERGVRHQYGDFDGNRAQIGKIDLAVLEDLGIVVNNYDELPLFDLHDDDFVWITGSDLSDGYFGDVGTNWVDLGLGIDFYLLSGNREDYDVREYTNGQLIIADRVLGRDGIDILANIERLEFADSVLAFDIGRFDNAGAAYMLYQAAYDRTPDAAGLGYWISRLDNGADIVVDVAEYFVNYAPEFAELYGANPTTSQYVDLLYRNVLNRPANLDGDVGYLFWEQQLNSGQMSEAYVLVNFANSFENVANVADAISNGIQYQAYMLVG